MDYSKAFRMLRAKAGLDHFAVGEKCQSASHRDNEPLDPHVSEQWGLLFESLEAGLPPSDLQLVSIAGAFRISTDTLDALAMDQFDIAMSPPDKRTEAARLVVNFMADGV